MRFKSTALFLMCTVFLCAQQKTTKSTSINKNVSIYSKETFFDEMHKEIMALARGKESLPTVYNNSTLLPKKMRIVCFPEGFSLILPDDGYIVNREGARYTFKCKKDPSVPANFDILISNFDIQEDLEQNNHFLVSKNKKLAMYGVYLNNSKTKKSKVLGFRLYYTSKINDNLYITARSIMFDSYEKSKLYAKTITSLNDCVYKSSYKAVIE